MGTPTYLPDDENHVFDLSNLNGIQPWLGIDHTNKAANKSKTRFTSMEKAIKIFNQRGKISNQQNKSVLVAATTEIRIIMLII